MNKKILFGRSIKDMVFAFGPSLVLVGLALFIAYKYVNPAPPDHLVITTSGDEGDYQTYAKLYRDIMKDDGVTLEIRQSTGAVENLKRLQDNKSDVDVGFVQDGLGSQDLEPDLVSLGSLYYEPLWVYYTGKTELTRFSQLKGKRIVMGSRGGGTGVLTTKLLKASGVTEQNSKFIHLGWQEAADELLHGSADAAFFLGTPDDPLIVKLSANRNLKLMSVDQAEAIVRQFPFLHHLVLPHGSLDLSDNHPPKDIDLVSATATLVAKDSLHPALIYLLLKAASQVHGEAGLLEKKNEFPEDRDFDFPLADEAKQFYKSGIPFWQRHLPFWIATLVDRFLVIMLPLIALMLPMIRMVPKILDWRVRSRIYQRYGELKYLETQLKGEAIRGDITHHLKQLDEIEDRVNHMKVPLDFSEHLYGLREHIEFVRGRLKRSLASST